MPEKKKANIRKLILPVFLLALVLALLFIPTLISLNGDKEMTVECGDSFEDPGASLRFGLKGKIRVGGDLDTSVPGNYVVKYSFLTQTVRRKVNVVDTTPPVITLSGMKTISAEKGSEYEEYGYTAIDNADGDVTEKVYTESDVNMDEPGTYHISYYAEDSAGNISRERRTVNVTEKGPMTMSMKEFDLNPFFSDVIAKPVPYDRDFFKQCIIMGDSFVGYMVAYQMTDLERLWSKGALNADDLESQTLYVGIEDSKKTFYELLDEKKPKYVIMLLGNQTSWYWSAEYYRTAFDKILSKLVTEYPDIHFDLCSMCPYDEEYDYKYVEGRGFLRNQRINEANTIYCELCRKYGLKFINAAEVFKDPETGYCKKEYLGEDHFHLNSEGYILLTDYITGHLDFN